MTIPDNYLELGIAAIVGFVFRVVFGLISKNELKSDEADQRLHEEIRNVRKEMKEVEERYRGNDITIFEKLSDLRERVTRVEDK
jgi:hypothetical protein